MPRLQLILQVALSSEDKIGAPYSATGMCTNLQTLPQKNIWLHIKLNHYTYDQARHIAYSPACWIRISNIDSLRIRSIYRQDRSTNVGQMPCWNTRQKNCCFGHKGRHITKYEQTNRQKVTSVLWL